MYILKNAILSIKRNKGRSLLIGIIVCVISCSCAITLAIKNSANKLIDSYQNQYDVIANISMDRKQIMGNFDPKSNSEQKEQKKEEISNIPSLTEQDILNYKDSSYVKDFYYTSTIGMNSNITKVSSSSNQPNMRRPGESSADFNLVGYSSINSMNEFINGKYTITDGNIDEDLTSNSCVINNELAVLNNLSVGDTIKLINSSDTSKTYELIISGIYSDNNDSEDNRMNMFTSSANTIITNTTTISKISSLDSDIKVNYNPSFVLINSSVINDFTDEIKNKGLNEYMTVTTNLDQVNESTKSISNLATFATTFLIITLIIGVVVLLIINMINIRERKYEIGVLRTIGMKKSLLTSQFIIELLIVSLTFMIIGTGIGAMISVPTANKLLENEIKSSEVSQNNVNKNFGKQGNMDNPPEMNRNNKINGVVKVDQVKSINAVVDYKVILELLIIGVGITLVSSASAMVSIERFSPLTILKERS